MSSTTTLLLLCLSVLLLLSHVRCWPHLQACGGKSRVTARHRECVAARYVPGYSLAGQGFDVATLRRKGGHVFNVRSFLNAGDASCTLYCNPLLGGNLQKVPLYISEWHSFDHECPFNLHSSSHNSVRSVVQAYTSHESDDWKLDLDMETLSDLEVGGSRSPVAQFAADRAREDRYTFSIHRLSCSLYSFSVSNKPPLSTEFQNDMVALPREFNSSTKAQYRRFVDTYGTHYIRQVYLGGHYRRVSAIRTCLSTVNGYSTSQVEACLGLGLTDDFGKPTYPRSKTTCSKILTNRGVSTHYAGGLFRNFSEATGGSREERLSLVTCDDSASYDRWLTSLKAHPDVIKYSLKPVHMLVRDAPRRAGVKATVQQYLKESGLAPHSSRSSSPPSCGNKKDPNLAPNCCPQKAWQGTLEVTIVRAFKLNGDSWGETDAYVKLWYGSIFRQTPVVLSDNPHWNARYLLGKVDTHLHLKVEVWDDDYYSDDLLGSCVKPVKQGTHIHKCSTTSGGLEFIVKLTCDSYLTGSKCDQYRPKG